MSIQPFIVGYGRAGRAIHESLSILRSLKPELGLRDAIVLKRSDPLKPARDAEKSVLFISSPHGLHAETILKAWQAGFHGIASEKPACVNLQQAEALRKIPARDCKTAVFHVYRQMWGPQTLKEMLERKEFGDLISIEGRYWQSSTAYRALHPSTENAWKNDVALSGPSDALLDVGTHWIDLAIFLADAPPTHASGEVSFVNAERPHRDSHAWVNLKFPGDVRAMASISKNIHGATNHFEINLIGSKKSASWTFLKPDEIYIGEGKDRRVMARKDAHLGSGHPPFHALGWLEGYLEISHRLLLDVLGQPAGRYPTVHENASMIEMIMKSGMLPMS